VTLSYEQIRAYFEHRHPGQRIQPRSKASVKCIFHDDSNASCTLFLDGAGGFNCHGCGAGGNVFQFEARLSGCSVAEAESRVGEIVGAEVDPRVGGKLGRVVAAYDYRDSDGRVLYQKRRYQPEGQAKTFRVYRPEGNGWVPGIDLTDGTKTKRVLYNQPQLVAANVAIVCEGEKDCDNVTQSGLWSERGSLRFATTCNFDGAWKPGESGKWLESYNAYFAGKFVVIFADNDDSGATWSQAVAYNVEPYAFQVKIVRLPGLPEKGDVSDWLETHTAKELEAQIGSAPAWRPARSVEVNEALIDSVEFAARSDSAVDWLLDNAIPVGSNGIIGGHPKAAKSFSSLDLAISAACGVDWLGMRIPRRFRTAIVSREDNAGLTRRRIKKLIAGRAEYAVLPGWMLINTREQTAHFKINDRALVDPLIDRLGKFGVELVVLDVFRSIHDSEENDNTEMSKVLDGLNRFQDELKCAVAVVHHISKAEGAGNIFRSLRGASAIHGWMEWGIGVSVINPEEEDRANYIRRVEFECKEATAPALHFRIAGAQDFSTARLELYSQQSRPTKPTPIRERRDLQ
jgi:putative DNA primase/helicase